MDKDDPIDDVINSDENSPDPDDVTIIGPPPDLDAGSGPEPVEEIEAVPVDDVTQLDFGVLDEGGDADLDIDKTVAFPPDDTPGIEENQKEDLSGEEFDIDKTVNFKPVEEDHPEEAFNIDKTVNFKPVEVKVPEQAFDIDKTVNFKPVEEEEPGKDFEIENLDGAPPGDEEVAGDGGMEGEEKAADVPPVKTGAVPRPTRRRLSSGTASRVKRRTAAEQYQQSSKPGKTFLVKKILFYGLPFSFIAMIAAGFVFKNEKDDMLWVGLMKNVGFMEDTTESEEEEAVANPHPEMVNYATVQNQIGFLTDKLTEIERQLQVTETWTRESAMETRGELDTAQEILNKSRKMAGDVKVWFEAYSRDMVDLQAAHESGDKERIAKLDEKIGRGKYEDLNLDEFGLGHVNAAVNRINALQRRADKVNVRLPSMEEITEGKLPGSVKKEHGRPSGSGTAVSFNEATVTPYFDISAGSWRRDEVLEEDLVFMGEPIRRLRDTILKEKELREDYVVLETFHFVNELESDPEEEQRDVVKDAKKTASLDIGGSTVSCRILKSAREERWVPVSDPMANQLPLKVETDEVKIVAVEIGQEDLAVGETSLPCTRVDYQGTIRNAKVKQTIWYSTKVPFWVVKKITEVDGASRVTETHLEYGKSSRPSFPVPEEETPGMTETPTETEIPEKETPSETETPAETEPPEEENPETPVEKETPGEENPETPVEKETPEKEKPEGENPETPEKEPETPRKTVEDHINEATESLKEALPLFQKVSKAIRKGLSDDREDLKTLQEMANKAEKLFGDAIEKYRRAKEISPDPERQEYFIGRLQKLQKRLGKNQAAIRKKMEE